MLMTLWLHIKDNLTNRFKCKNLGELNKVLNMGIMHTADGVLCVSQVTYVRDVLGRFKVRVSANANSVKMPADPKIQVHAGGATKVNHKTLNTQLFAQI